MPDSAPEGLPKVGELNEELQHDGLIKRAIKFSGDVITFKHVRKLIASVWKKITRQTAENVAEATNEMAVQQKEEQQHE